MRIGQKVKVKGSIAFKGREGIITGIHKGVIPYGVTLTGEQHETDFSAKELEIVKEGE